MGERGVEYLYKVSQKISEVDTYRDGVVTISADVDRLKLDFLNEVRSRDGLDVKKAELMADNLELFFDKKAFNTHIVDNIQQAGIKNKPWRVFAPISKVGLPYTDILAMGGLLGSTYARETAPAVYLNPNHIINHLKIPKSVTSEAIEAGVIQGVHGVWRHEREHLIRMLDPSMKVSDTKIRVANMVTRGITMGLIYMGTLYYVPEDLLNKLPDINKAVLSLSIPLCSILLSESVGDGLWYRLWNSAEKAANVQGKNGKNLSSLFDFQFDRTK